MEKIRWIETPPCRACVPRPEYCRRFACLGCEKLRLKPPTESKPAGGPSARLCRVGRERRGRILALRARGVSYGAIARELSLPRSTVQGIVFRAGCTQSEKDARAPRINTDG